ncbi:GNAT family N-acetyltransferase [Dongia rigui]|uniref:GNAT family N-acetyltransferase n=1 Tax=Dongia rigui TaxID=940149 RepID=A0ABU5DZR8_9PROT|nr:GNAT family N-acetyltransferase [Dongia rigui]MDY0872041.1 GNAT family N-acetyltransferase [Dongia rigui]
MTHPPLPLGYSTLAPGHIANVVTCLEMKKAPPPRPVRPADAAFVLAPWRSPGVADFRALFRRVGQDWLWHSRLHMADEKLRAILDSQNVDLYRLMLDDKVLGLLELDFREARQCEMSFFGLVPEAIGTGAGRYLVDRGIHLAWNRRAGQMPIERLWVHTCTFDHPNALGFYQKAGFVPYAFMVEVQDDPRLTGHLPREAAPHIPLVDPK